MAKMVRFRFLKIAYDTVEIPEEALERDSKKHPFQVADFVKAQDPSVQQVSSVVRAGTYEKPDGTNGPKETLTDLIESEVPTQTDFPAKKE